MPVCRGFLSANYVQVSSRALSQWEQEIIQTFGEFLQRNTHTHVHLLTLFTYNVDKKTSCPHLFTDAKIP